MKINNTWSRICLIILCAIVVWLYSYNNQFNILEGDENFSLGLANNTDEYVFFTQNEIDKYSNTEGWFYGVEYRDYLAVRPGEQFDFANVFSKQKADVHPPLYYSLVHIISSFTPEKVNVFGVSFINIVSMCGVMILLFLSMKKMFGEKIITVLPPTLWLLSGACYLLAEYIRMYGLLQLWIMAMIYLHICIICEEKYSKRRIIALASVVCLGGLTHYYFYVFSFFLAASYVISQMILDRNKLLDEIKKLLPYVSAYLIGGMVALAVFPKAVYHVLKSNVGGQVQDNLKGNGIPFAENWGILNQNLFQGHFEIVAIIGIVAMILYGYFRNRQNKEEKKGTASNQFKVYIRICVILTTTVVLYLLLIMKITIYVAWYYISPVFAAVILLVSLVVGLLYFVNKYKVSLILFGLLTIGSFYIFCIHSLPDMLQENRDNKEYMEMVDSLSGNDCIYLSESWNCLYGNQLPAMAHMDEVRCITPEEFEKTDTNKLLQGRRTTEEDIIVITRKIEDPSAYFEQLKQQTGLTLELVWSDGKTEYYRRN